MARLLQYTIACYLIAARSSYMCKPPQYRGCRTGNEIVTFYRFTSLVCVGAANKPIYKGLAMRSPYTNPLARMEPNQPTKTFRIFTSALSAALWLKEKHNAERVVRDARGKMRVRKWADGRVAVTYFGSIPKRRHFTLAPARELSPALYACENYERLQRTR